MAPIPKNIIDHILDIAKIEEVVGDFPEIKLRKRGVRYEGICPFHEDRGYGNFSVYPRENCYRCFKCDAKGDAVKFLMDHGGMNFADAIRWLGKKYNIEVDDVPINWTPPPPRPTPPPLPTLTLPRCMVVKRMATNNDALVHWIETGIDWGNEQMARIPQVLHDYCVGHSTVQGRHEFTVFWQIDVDGNVRTAHYMKYKPDGHRVKDKQDYPTDWLHSLLIRKRNDSDPWPYPQYYDPDHQEARLCLFGEHLLKKYPRATVKLVESEKTALLMAIAYGNNDMQVWLACCGASNLTRERLKPLIDEKRQIILYPDRDGVKLWQQKAEQLHYGNVSVDDVPVTTWWREEDGDKADIADVVVRMINQAPPPPTTIDEVKQRVPKMAPIIDKLNLEIVT